MPCGDYGYGMKDKKMMMKDKKMMKNGKTKMKMTGHFMGKKELFLPEVEDVPLKPFK